MAKICMLIDSLGSGGAQRQFVYLACGLKDTGHEVSVFYYHPIHFFQDKLTSKGVSTFLIQGRNPALQAARIRSEIKRAQPDILISFLDTPNLLACITKLTLWKKPKLIVSERSTDSGPISFRRKTLLQLFRFADLVIANSKTQTENLKKRRWLEKKTQWIPNCVDINKFKPLPNKKTGGDSTGPISILTVASFQKNKNPQLVARWVASAEKKALRFTFDWYGNQLLKERPSIEAGNAYLEARSICNDSSAFKMHPPSEKIDQIYPMADAFCLPSFYEGTPNVICEAMACGLPILCSRVCDNPFIVEEGVNGFLFDPASIDSFSEALNKLHSLGAGGRKKMGELNRERAQKLFSEENYARAWGEAIS